MVEEPLIRQRLQALASSNNFNKMCVAPMAQNFNWQSMWHPHNAHTHLHSLARENVASHEKQVDPNLVSRHKVISFFVPQRKYGARRCARIHGLQAQGAAIFLSASTLKLVGFAKRVSSSHIIGRGQVAARHLDVMHTPLTPVQRCGSLGSTVRLSLIGRKPLNCGMRATTRLFHKCKGAHLLVRRPAFLRSVYALLPPTAAIAAQARSSSGASVLLPQSQLLWVDMFA